MLDGGPGGYCDFDVLVTYKDVNEYIIHETTAPEPGPGGGTITTDKITGRARATLENLGTHRKVSYNISGPGTVVSHSDGRFSIDSHGPNLLWTRKPFSYPGVPEISYTTGHVTVQVASSGVTTSYSLSGRQTDVCKVLAS